MTDIIIAALGMFCGELYGNFVGGGSLVTQAVLQGVLDMNIREAMALDNSAVMGANLGMLYMLWRTNKIQWYFLPFAFAQLLGALAGVWILIHLPEVILQIIFLAAIVGVVIKNFFFSGKQKKEKGFKPSKRNIFLLTIVAFFLGTYTSAFVIGDWIIYLVVLTGVFHFRYHYAVFLLIVSETVIKPFSSFAYYQNGLLDLSYLIPMFFAALLGGLIAGFFLEKIQSDTLEKILKYVSLVLVIYLVWNIGGSLL